MTRGPKVDLKLFERLFAYHHSKASFGQYMAGGIWALLQERLNDNFWELV